MGDKIKERSIDKHHLHLKLEDHSTLERLSTLRSPNIFRQMYSPYKLVYTWGNILCKGSNIYKQAQPYQQPTQNTMHISCGSSHIVAVDSYGDAFVLGSNEHGQLGLQGELHARTFKKFSSNYIGLIRKAVCIGDSTFFITREEELYFTGRISFNRNDKIIKANQYRNQDKVNSREIFDSSLPSSAQQAITTSLTNQESFITGKQTLQ